MGETRKVLYVSGTRADYGLMRSALEAIEGHSGLELEVAATGMHIMDEFGHTIDEIKQDGFHLQEVGGTYRKDEKAAMADFVGYFIRLLTLKVVEVRPDMILLLGDKGEMLAAAVVGAYLTVPVAHLHGGEVTSTVDEFVRHAITKLVHLHLPATRRSAERIEGMGEESWRINVVGAPGLDEIFQGELLSREEICGRLSLDPAQPVVLVVQHPVTMEVDGAAEQMRLTLDVVCGGNHQTVIVYPNADAGGRRMIEVIKEFEGLDHVRSFKSLPHHEYLSLMERAEVMVGNSSSGIIEAPSLGLAFVNIGTRQQGRERAENVIDVGYERGEIAAAIDKALNDREFREIVAERRNPYGDGKTGPRIADILSDIDIDKRLLDKRMAL